VPEAACAIKAFDSPDDGPIGPKHVDINNYKSIKLETKYSEFINDARSAK
jgi:hypothetical protein